MTLKNGRPSSKDSGGSIFLMGNNGNPSLGHGPLFQNIIFEGNQGKYDGNGSDVDGGAVFGERGSTPYFRDVTFINNHTNRRGGAVYLSEAGRNTPIVFERNTFINNHGTSNRVDLTPKGGAVHLEYSYKTIFESNVFDSNYVSINGGCCSNRGGAISIRGGQDSLIIHSSKFRGNSVFTPPGNDSGHADGGAISLEDNKAHIMVYSSLFDGNSVQAGVKNYQGGPDGKYSRGGAIRIQNGSIWNESNKQWEYPQVVNIFNNTFVNNAATVTPDNNSRGYGGAFVSQDGGIFRLVNNIFFGNTAEKSNPGDIEPDFSIWNNNDQLEWQMGFNNTQYNEWANGLGSDNINRDPKFVLDGSDDQYALSDKSFLIGAGTLVYEGQAAPSLDILGNPRPITEPDHPDIGAYENVNINPPYPDKVHDIAADPADKSVILTWTANTEADLAKYVIYQSETQGFTPSSLDSVGEAIVGTNTFTVSGLTNRTPYYFRVNAVNNTGNVGEFSDEVSAIPEYEGPIWWVAVDGDNADDGDEANPFVTINHAVQIAGDGHTVMIKPGTYSIGASGSHAVINDKSLTIIGTDGYENTIIDNDGNLNHFYLRNQTSNTMTVTLIGLSLMNGSGGSYGSVVSDDVDSLFIFNSLFQGNSGDMGGAVSVFGDRGTVIINNSGFVNNAARERGGAIWFNSSNFKNILDIKNSIFESNGVEYDPNYSEPFGGAVYSRNHTTIENSYFGKNYLIVNSQDNIWAHGAAIWINHRDGNNSLNLFINGSIFSENRLAGNGNGGGSGVAMFVSGTAEARIQNSVFNKNYLYAPQGGDGTAITFGWAESDNIKIINNSFYDNHYFDGSSYNELSFHHMGDDGADIRIFNNILYSDGTEIQTTTGDGSLVKASNNIFKAISNVEASKDFRNHQGLDFSLKPTSDLIDGGIQFHSDGNSANNVYAPIKDLRGYYRIGLPDVGAYEFGASKYLLDISDNITGDMDTTFVKLGDSIKFTITTNDISGNQVPSNEPVNWTIYPNDKYVSFLSGDTTTSGGDAEATFEVSSLDRSKGFRFRIRADVGDAFLGSKLYIIEEIITGAPPTVANLKVTPEDWTSNSEFTISWENPTWDRDLIGINLLLIDEIGQKASRFEAFPDGGVLTSFTDNLIESGIYTAYLWLVDELGNENSATRDSVTLKFDNIPPNPFKTNWPANDDWVNPQPQFWFGDAGDFPSGVEEYYLHFSNRNGSNENISNYGDINRQGVDGYVEIDNPLDDGYYRWFMETKDYAGNVTRSDTAYFGVDTQPPTITHSNPLSIIDEGVDSPAINASFFDAASGVSMARLFYRTAGSGGSWKSNDLISGSSYIQASDVNFSGIEYYIESEDNLGNMSKWPETGPYQSIKVRSATNITSATRWSNGIPGGTDVSNYQLFSIPFDVGNAKSSITSVMGPADKFKYRLYKYGGGEEPWQEDPSSVTMSEAYFFIFDPAEYEVEGAPTKITFDFGQGTSTPTNPPYEKTISASDWTLFGSPYNFNLILSNVYAEDGTSIRDAGTLYGFSNGSWRSVSSIEPWQGYAFKSAGATKLIFDGRGGFAMAAKERNYEDMPYAQDEWVIDISASTGTTRDDLNAVGVRNMAENGYDPFDEFEPPTLPGDVVLRIDNRDWDNLPDLYAKDIRKPSEEGHYWDLQVFAPTNGQRTYLTFDGLGYVPEEYDIFLVNKTTKQAKNLEWESGYQFANTGSEDYLKQEFRLVIGTKEFVQDNNAGVNLYPDAFSLAQNYPNPFNPQTSIMISLEEDANVDLVIYNLLGEEITRLAANEYRPAGYYNFIWNGRNAIGDKVATGVYFYHAMIRNDQGKVVLNKTRKMIFLK
ncbi:MAG: fibronectin type III domain-containing protein [Candidatus Marinimicrobia bacterium]|nr:fibronectin type III domain-containing protein [Candidatus Neomarinimicrobiota bacterium]